MPWRFCNYAMPSQKRTASINELAARYWRKLEGNNKLKSPGTEEDLDAGSAEKLDVFFVLQPCSSSFVTSKRGYDHFLTKSHEPYTVRIVSPRTTTICQCNFLIPIIQYGSGGRRFYIKV